MKRRKSMIIIHVMGVKRLNMYLLFNISLLVNFREEGINTLFPLVEKDSVFMSFISFGAIPSISAIHYHELNGLSPSLYAVSRNSAPPARLYPGPRYGASHGIEFGFLYRHRIVNDRYRGEII